MVFYYLKGKRDICEGYLECLFRHGNRCECHSNYHWVCPDIPVDPECSIKYDMSIHEKVRWFFNAFYVMTDMNIVVDLDGLVKWAKRVNGLSMRMACKALVPLLLRVESIIEKVAKDAGVVSDKFLNKLNDMQYVMWFRFYRHSFDGKAYLMSVKIDARCYGEVVKFRTYVY